MSLTDIPVEILEEIVQLTPKADQLTLCITSKLLNAVAIRYLYRSIDLASCSHYRKLRCCRTLKANSCAALATRDLEILVELSVLVLLWLIALVLTVTFLAFLWALWHCGLSLKWLQTRYKPLLDWDHSRYLASIPSLLQFWINACSPISAIWNFPVVRLRNQSALSSSVILIFRHWVFVGLTRAMSSMILSLYPFPPSRSLKALDISSLFFLQSAQLNTWTSFGTTRTLTMKLSLHLSVPRLFIHFAIPATDGTYLLYMQYPGIVLRSPH